MATRAHSLPFATGSVKELVTRTFQNFGEDAVPRLAAAFSFYTMLSLAPLLMLAIVVAGMFLGEGSSRDTILRQVQAALGNDSREMVETLIQKAQHPGASIPATVISLLLTFFYASNVFVQLTDTLNAIWGVQQKEQSFIRSLLVTRVAAFVAALAFGALVLAWLAIDSWLSWVEKNTARFTGWQVVSFLVSVLFLSLVFAIVFKLMPAGRTAWRDVWLGAVVGAIGVALGKLLLAEYFSRMDVAGAYGPAGALVLILLWIYYTSQIFFFGAELVYTYAHTFGSRKGMQDNRQLSYS